MQLICEAYFMMKEALGLSNDELYDVFDEWNRGELDSYLIEITRDIFSVKDPEAGGYLVDKILDKAGAKGTGKWMSQLALDLGVPSTLVTEAVYARCLSAMKDARVRASKVLKGPSAKYDGDTQEVHRADSPGACTPRRSAATPRASCSCRRRPTEHDWPLNLRRHARCCGAAAASSGPCSSTASRKRSTPIRSSRTCCSRRTSPKAVARSAGRLAARGRDGRRARHSRAGVRHGAGLLRRLPPRPPAGEPAASPARLLRRAHLRAHSTSRARSTPIGSAYGDNRQISKRGHRPPHTLGRHCPPYGYCYVRLPAKTVRPSTARSPS